jgi:DNA-binding NarL/FixJ family response regulator
VKELGADKSDSVLPSPIRVVLADDHALVRAGVRALLEKIQGVEVLAEAGDGREALELIGKFKPDVVLLDIAMPELSGLDVLRQTVTQLPNIKVIVLSIHETEEYAVHALRSGAAGFLPKTAASVELELALKTVVRGGRYLSPQISKLSQSDQHSASDVRPMITELTPRQSEVLEMIARGLSTKDIARALKISAKTVETHRAQLMERLKIYEVAGLVRYAIRAGLVRIDE